MCVYSPMELPVHLLQKYVKDGQKQKEKLIFNKKRWRKKKKQLTEDAEIEFSDCMRNDSFANNYLDYIDDSYSYENSDLNNDISKDIQADYENFDDTGILSERDFLIIKTLINLKFSLPNLTSPQPFIESTFQLINENLSNSMHEMADQVSQIKELMEETEKQVQENNKLNKQILEKTNNFKKDMKQIHQNMKILSSVPLFHRVIFKLQDLFSYFYPYFHRLYVRILHDWFNWD